eukprot:3530778-Amphidinium_carterae.1
MKVASFAAENVAVRSFFRYALCWSIVARFLLLLSVSVALQHHREAKMQMIWDMLMLSCVPSLCARKCPRM